MHRRVIVVAAVVTSLLGASPAALRALQQDPPTPTPVLPAELNGSIHVRWGHPGGSCTILPKDFYVICHDGPRRVPLWVTYHLSPADLRANVKRRDSFKADPDLPAEARAELADYKGSEYDRGHMAPAADFRRSKQAMAETFYLSNMAPQRPNLNRRVWERLEGQVRELAREHGSIWIFTGPLYLDDAGTRRAQPTEFLADRVAIPSHFFKVILCEHADGAREMFAFMMRNQRTLLAGGPGDYVVSVDQVERLSGLDFFAGLPDAEETRLEARTATRWPVATTP